MMRRIMRLLVGTACVSICLLVVGIASASDEIGVFFDARGEENCLAAEQFAVVTAYIVLIEPSASGGVAGWECSLEIDEAAVLAVSLAGSGLNFDSSNTDFCVGLGSPLFGTASVRLASLDVMVTGEQAAFYLYPYYITPSIEGSPVYADGSDTSNLIALTINTLSGENLSAGVNIHQCFPQETSWTELKRLYH